MELRTPRLILREWREEDFAFSYALATDPEVMRYASREPVDAEAVRRLLGRRIATTMMQPRTHFGLAVTLAETGEVIGRCGLYLTDDPRVAWISYELQRDQWGHGYMPEAVTALLRLGFEELQLHRVYAECHPDNRASYRLMEKVGMRREGYLRASHWEHDEWWDVLLYAILEQDWPPTQEPK